MEPFIKNKDLFKELLDKKIKYYEIIEKVKVSKDIKKESDKDNGEQETRS